MAAPTSDSAIGAAASAGRSARDTSIERVFPTRGTLGLAEAVDDIASLRARRGHAAFSEESLRVCATLSRGLLGHPALRAHPQLMALGYWLRPVAIKRLQEHFSAGDKPGHIRVPRGLVFHLPPANVDTLFVYSWLLSLLVGNSNLIRLSAHTTPAGEILLDQLERAFADTDLGARNMIVSYERNDRVTTALSAEVDLRCVWGGDDKVAHVRRLPLPPHAAEIVFPDRFSMSAIRSRAFLELDDASRHALLEKFFNDVFWFNQMGCASPRLVAWVGPDACARDAAAAFFAGLREVVRAKGYRVELGVALEKTTSAYRAILDLPIERYDVYDNELSVLALERLTDCRDHVFGAGTLMQVAVPDLFALGDFVRRKDQTLTQFGFSPPELSALVHELGGRGIDRIVPIGKALEFHHVWDGIDLMDQFTRLVQLG